ncbi:nucleotidyltransferase family protein [Salinimonas profundi]|nr:nucleotidyltransferase family protein [Salinimonas profundi]
MPVLPEQDALLMSEQTLRQDIFRMACLRAVASLELPDAMIGAGFIRNMIWDALHQYSVASPLNDIDVVYFDKADTSRATEQDYEQRLAAMYPAANWEVRNQARMHTCHNDVAYQDTSDGIRRWVELPTCVGVKLCGDQLRWFAPYGLRENWKGEIRINPEFPRPAVFTQRVAKKDWLSRWPHLTVVQP